MCSCVFVFMLHKFEDLAYTHYQCNKIGIVYEYMWEENISKPPNLFRPELSKHCLLENFLNRPR